MTTLWLTLHVKFKSELPAELSKGATFTEVISMMGMPNTIEWTVDEYEKPRTLSISGTGMADQVVTHHQPLEVAGALQRHAVYVEDEVPAPEPGPGRGTPLGHCRHFDPGRAAQAAGQLRRQWPAADRDAQVGPAHTALAHQCGDDAQRRRVDGHG